MSVSLSNLSSYQRLISTEALAIHKPDAKVVARMIDYFDGVKEYVGAAISGIGLSNAFKSFDASKVAKVVKNIPYDDLASVPMPTPVGMNVSYIDYIDVLSKAQFYTTTLYDDVLAPFSKWVSECLNDPKQLESVRSTLKVKQHDLTAIKLQLKDANSAGDSAVMKYGRLLARNADWDAIGKNMNDLLKTQRKLSNDRIQNIVRDITENVDKLIMRMTDPNTSYPVSSKNLAELSKVCYDMAVEVEFYAVVDYQIRALEVALNDAMEHLIKNFK